MRITAVSTAIITAGLCPLAGACVWDYDTLKAEAQGLPSVFDALVGRIERNPDLYYEMRIERLTELLKNEPGDLDAYDGAAVACDRLGRHDDAIAWMGKKRAVLDANPDRPDVADHEYRYLANLGTFHVHRWFSNGRNFENMYDVNQARMLIASAIELNPEAHFGRETYQLLVIDWILALRRVPKQSEWYPDTIYLYTMSHGPESRDWRRSNKASEQREKDIEAIIGLMALGAGWESVDLVVALQNLLAERQDASLANIAGFRIKELIANGGRSVASDLEYAALEKRLVPPADILHADHIDANREEFRRQRENANEWREQRERFMLKKLRQGRHPDTDPDFWGGYVPVAKLEVVEFESPHLKLKRRNSSLQLIAVAVSILLPIAAGCVFYYRRIPLW